LEERAADGSCHLIFLSSTIGDDATGDGTKAKPVKTLPKGNFFSVLSQFTKLSHFFLPLDLISW
jgi:hypothetical protein